MIVSDRLLSSMAATGRKRKETARSKAKRKAEHEKNFLGKDFSLFKKFKKPFFIGSRIVLPPFLVDSLILYK